MPFALAVTALQPLLTEGAEPKELVVFTNMLTTISHSATCPVHILVNCILYRILLFKQSTTRE